MLLDRFAWLALFAAVASIPVYAQNWHIATTFHPGGEGGWDYVTVDAPNHRLFVTRATHTQAIDTRTGKLLADIPVKFAPTASPSSPKLNRGFITDGGGSGAILVFDLKTYRVLGRIPTCPTPTALSMTPALTSSWLSLATVTR
jgi:DNA-binding beta-propeller fold protein YncE